MLYFQGISRKGKKNSRTMICRRRNVLLCGDFDRKRFMKKIIFLRLLMCLCALNTWSSCLSHKSGSHLHEQQSGPSKVVQPQGKTVVYISNADSREIFVMKLDTTTGQLSFIESEPTSGNVMPLALSPDHRYLYASLRSEPYAVSTFSINPQNGMLDHLATAKLPVNMAYLSVDQSGRYLFAASYSGSKVSVNFIGPDGMLQPEPLQVLSTGRNAHAIVADHLNRHVYVPNLGDDQILQYTLDPGTRMLRPNDPPLIKTASGAGPRHLAEHPEGRFWFLINELDGTINSYESGQSGALKFLSSVNLMPEAHSGKPSAADIHVHPSGLFLYTTERGSNTLCAFRIDPLNGKLTVIAHYPTETQPRSFNIDPSGKFLIVAGQQSHRLSVYRINPQSGTLSKVSDAAAGRNPNWIEVIQLAR